MTRGHPLRRRAPALLAAVLLAVSATAGAAQEPASELERLREANLLEAAGNVQGAEAVVKDVLEANPASLTALLALERLLSVQGRGADVLPFADRLIAAEPRSAVGHQLRLRILARTGTDAALGQAVATWTRATPAVETPWRESAVIWRERGDVRRAIGVLETGRRYIDRDDALALELGDAYAEAGDVRRAAAEWARAVGPYGRGFMLVQRRLNDRLDGGAAVLPLLVEQLAAPPHTAGRLRAATLLAIDARLEGPARRHAEALAAATDAAGRDAVLTEVARRSDHAGLPRLAGWAYGELLRQARDPAATLALRTRVAELALQAGDTAMAAQAYGELEQASAAGSPQRRQAIALRIQLTAREGALDRAAADLIDFRAEFANAAEVDAAATEVADGYVRAGDAASALRVLSGVQGPRSAQLRGRLRLLAGDLAASREELLSAAALLRGAAATETLALAALVMRLTSAGGEIVARFVGTPAEEREELVRTALADTRGLQAQERAAVLEFVAGLAERAGLGDDADALRREIAATLPRTHEAAGALLALARRALAAPEREDEARVLLERLVVEYPRSTLAPQARQELQRLRARTPTQ